MTRGQQYQERFQEWVDRNPLRIARQEDGLTVLALAALLGVHSSTLKNWENSAHFPDDDNMLAIARYLDVSPSEARELWAAWIKSRPRFTR